MEPSLYCNTEECTSPVLGTVKGEIPSWLNGDLYRNGPGIFSLGDSHYQHWFDGLALLHHFSIHHGQVSYRSKYIRSEAYKNNTKANRIITSEFGTVAYPDPCKNIFQRLFAWFSPRELTDNTLVTVTPQSDFLYTATETNVIHKINPQTMDTESRIDISKHVAVNLATAHYQRDPDGTLHNLGQFFQGRPKYSIIKVPPPTGEKAPFEEAEIVGSVFCRWPFSIGYMHSFGMSDNYYVFIEQPFCLNVKSMMLTKVTNKPFLDCMQWHGEYKCLFHILDKKTGEKINLPIKYLADPFFVFHHINTYEENDCLIVDVCAYENPDIVYIHYMADLKAGIKKPFQPAVVRRYVLPLDVSHNDPIGKNHVTLPNCSASSERQSERQIFCKPQVIGTLEGIELPQINYEKNNGRKYRYIYGVTGTDADQLGKIDIDTNVTLTWTEPNVHVSEPVFVASPDAKQEDDGVILAVVYKVLKPRNVTFLLVLDASSFKELGRVEFDLQLPRDIHGVFVAGKA